MKLRPFLHVILISCAVAIVYLPGMAADFLSLDDRFLVDCLQSSEVSLGKVFLLGQGDYFRPLTFLSLLLDFKLWGTNPAAFHATNVGLHLCNALLIYVLCFKLFRDSPRRSVAALVSAAFFGLAPINTEAVMWVSGRTDLLCGLFFLLCLSVITLDELPAWRVAMALFFCFAASLLAKESSVALLGVVPLYFYSRRPLKLYRGALLTGALLLAAGIYFMMRLGTHVRIDSGVAKVIAGGQAKHIGQIFFESLAAYGFYLRKLAWPFPLNFGIISIEEQLYAICALGALPLFGCFYWRCHAVRLPLLIIVLCLIPPLLALHGRLAWTPYAERYLYLPMVGWSLLVGFLASRVGRLSAILILVLILLNGFPTLSRVGVWTDQPAFWRDLMVKSPGFPRGYLGYAVELIRLGRYAEAEPYLNKARDLGYNKDILWQSYAAIYLRRRDYASYEETMARAATLSARSTELYGRLNAVLSTECDRLGGANTVYPRIIKYNLLAFERDKGYADGLYNVAKLYLLLGDQHNASRYLRLFLDQPGDNLFKPAAWKMLNKFESSANDNKGTR